MRAKNAYNAVQCKQYKVGSGAFTVCMSTELGCSLT